MAGRLRNTPPRGQISLAAQVLSPTCLRIEVADNGIGIPADMLEEVFDLFTQVGGALDRAQGGMGIGLSLARRLVELHGGSMRATSAGEQQGSIFTVELPLLEQRGESVAAQHDSDRSPQPNAGKRVLVVDDNVDAAETLSMLLGLEGHHVTVVHTGGQALEVASRDSPEIIFLDIGLPDLNGYDVAKRLRANPGLREAWLVALTGWASQRDQQLARAAGIDLHLTKPVSVDDFARALVGSRSSQPRI